MALDKTTLISDLKAISDAAEARSKVANATPEQVKQAWAEEMAAAIEKYVKSGKVQVGITVTVNTTSGAGSTTSEGTIH